MEITTKHPEYSERIVQWGNNALAIKGEMFIKEEGERFLPKTQGMVKNDAAGKQYLSYKLRARFFDISAQAQSALLGLAFEKPAAGNPDNIFALSGESDATYAVRILREIIIKGRVIAIADVHDDAAAVTLYHAETMINWGYDLTGKLTFAVFEEEVPENPSDPLSHDKMKVYRLWEMLDGRAQVTLYGDDSVVIGDTVLTALDYLPIVIFGSIDLSPKCDPIPLSPIVECAVSAYRISADYMQALFMAAQPTPTVNGITESQWDKMIEQGIGSSALWWLGDEGTAQFLEVSGVGIEALRLAITDELKHAESHAVRLTQNDSGVESAAAMAIRSASQHATLYGMIRTLEEGVDRMNEILSQRNNLGAPEPFKITADFTPQFASSQIITALNNAVSQMNVPKSILYQTLRQMKLTEKTDDELDAELDAAGGLPGIIET